MKNLILFAYCLLLLLTATSETDLSPVLVQCSNTTLSSDDDMGSCWKEGASVVCNSLEYGLRKAERLGTSMLVENTSQCTVTSKCFEDDYCFSTTESNSTITSNSTKRENKIKAITNTTFHCSPGFVLRRNTSSTNEVCTCLEDVHDIVKCATIAGSEKAFIQNDQCMTYNNNSDDIAVAACKFSCPANNLSLLDHKTSFYFLPDNVSDLKETMCSNFNRQGFLCSECHPGYMPLAHSYLLDCVPCNLSRKQLALNWMGYLALAVLPQSIIFLLMAIFKVGVTSPPFVSLVQVFQVATTPMYVHAIMRHLSCWTVPLNRLAMGFLQSTITFYGFFNLEFFRILSTSLCLNLDMIELQLLDYASAFWPLFLIIWAYVTIELHSRDFKPIVYAWKPVQFFLGYFQHEWHMKSSLVETFASFLLLSWIKLISISYNLLIVTCVLTVDRDGNVSQDCSHLYYSPTVKLFSHRHLASGIIAISIFIIFIVLPFLLLLFYPFKFFQSLLNRCGFNFRALHVFMDSFQGSFRDGTDGSMDYRWFSSIYLVLRIALILLGSIIKSRYSFPIASIMLMTSAVAVGVLQPYKRLSHNVFDATLILILATLFAAHGATSIAQLATTQGFHLSFILLTCILVMLPIMASIGYLVWWAVKVRLNRAQFCVRVYHWWHRKRALLKDSLADRVSNPQDYELVTSL